MAKKADLHKDTTAEKEAVAEKRVSGEANQEKTSQNDKILQLLAGVSENLGTLSEKLETIEKRVNKIETGGTETFKDGATEADIEFAQGTRANVSPRISEIVDNLLGSDFGIELEEREDQPGFLFTLIVPDRLSENQPDKRPVYMKDKDGKPTNEYQRNEDGSVVYEDYIPQDRRSRVITSSASYDVIRAFCEKVRTNIVNRHMTANQPLPVFKIS